MSDRLQPRLPASDSDPSGPAGGSLTGTYPNPAIAASGVAPGTYTYASITVNAEGRVTAAASGASPGAPTFRVVSTSVAYAAAANDVVLCDTSGGGFAVTLPSAVGIAGKSVTVKKVSSDGNTLAVDTTAGQTIDGQGEQAWSSQYTSMTVVSDDANWHII